MEIAYDFVRCVGRNQLVASSEAEAIVAANVSKFLDLLLNSSPNLRTVSRAGFQDHRWLWAFSPGAVQQHLLAINGDETP